jgi:hypothetical protein
MEHYSQGSGFRPEFKSKEVILQKGALPHDTKAALANMADVDDDKMSILINVSQFSVTNHKFVVQNDEGSGVFFYWYNQLSSGYKKGAVQFILNDTVTNIRLDYQEDPDSAEKDKQMLTKINRKGGIHELVGRFKVEILHSNIKEFYDKITRHFEKIEEPFNLPQPEHHGGLDEAVFEGSDGNMSGDDEEFNGGNGQGLFIDPGMLGETEKMKSVSTTPAIGNGFLGFDFDSAVGGKGFADLFGSQVPSTQKPVLNQQKQSGGRKSSFEDLLMFMDGDAREASNEPALKAKQQQISIPTMNTKPQISKVTTFSNPFLDSPATSSHELMKNQNLKDPIISGQNNQFQPPANSIGFSGTGISKMDQKPLNIQKGNGSSGFGQAQTTYSYQNSQQPPTQMKQAIPNPQVQPSLQTKYTVAGQTPTYTHEPTYQPQGKSLPSYQPSLPSYSQQPQFQAAQPSYTQQSSYQPSQPAYTQQPAYQPSYSQQAAYQPSQTTRPQQATYQPQHYSQTQGSYQPQQGQKAGVFVEQNYHAPQQQQPSTQKNYNPFLDGPSPTKPTQTTYYHQPANNNARK